MTVSVTDVATELGRPTPDLLVTEQWQSWILRAYRLVENRFGSTKFATLDGSIVDEVVMVAVSEHIRAWRDTTASQYTVTVDDGTVSRKYDAGIGYLTIPDALWELLDPTLGLDGAFTITPYATPDTPTTEAWL
jgi:hypothetical protein